tara:strand:+ start:31 stop:354 length:324 start_codon:yes stop_codon:yes gene_type:complete
MHDARTYSCYAYTHHEPKANEWECSGNQSRNHKGIWNAKYEDYGNGFNDHLSTSFFGNSIFLEIIVDTLFECSIEILIRRSIESVLSVMHNDNNGFGKPDFLLDALG